MIHQKLMIANICALVVNGFVVFLVILHIIPLPITFITVSLAACVVASAKVNKKRLW